MAVRTQLARAKLHANEILEVDCRAGFLNAFNQILTAKKGLTIHPESNFVDFVVRHTPNIGSGDSPFIGDKEVIFSHNHTLIESKRETGHHWYKLLTQIRRYCFNNIKEHASHFIVMQRGTYVVFGEYNPKWFKDNGHLYPNKDQHVGKLFIGLYVTDNGVEAVPITPNWYPNFVAYDLVDERHVYPITVLLNYLALNQPCPTRNLNLEATHLHTNDFAGGQTDIIKGVLELKASGKLVWK